MPRLHSSCLPTIVLCGALVTFSNGVYAQTNAADSMDPSATSPGTTAMVQTPPRGIPMEQVQTRYGVPSARLPAVGDPPITRWVYDDFTVYFEYQYVIHSVPNQ